MDIELPCSTKNISMNFKTELAVSAITCSVNEFVQRVVADPRHTICGLPFGLRTTVKTTVLALACL